MGQFTTYAINAMMDHCMGTSAYTPSATVEISLWVGDPTVSGAGGTEAAYTNYARKTIAFDAAAARLLNQTSQIDFNQSGATGQSGITHWGVHRPAGDGGQMLAFGSITGAPINVVEGNTPSVPAGDADLYFGTNNMSTYLAHALLNLFFRNTAFSAPTTSIALATSTLAVTDTDLTGKEVANANNYARLSFTDWSSATAGAVTNNTDTQWTAGTAPTGSWGTVVAAAVMDSGTYNGGNMLWFDNATVTDQAVNNGDTVKFAAGNFDLQLT